MCDEPKAGCSTQNVMRYFRSKRKEIVVDLEEAYHSKFIIA